MKQLQLWHGRSDLGSHTGTSCFFTSCADHTDVSGRVGGLTLIYAVFSGRNKGNAKLPLEKITVG